MRSIFKQHVKRNGQHSLLLITSYLLQRKERADV